MVFIALHRNELCTNLPKNGTIVATSNVDRRRRVRTIIVTILLPCFSSFSVGMSSSKPLAMGDNIRANVYRRFKGDNVIREQNIESIRDYE